MTAQQWFKVAELDDVPDGRVTTVVAGTQSICLTNCGGRIGALDNRCPHQGGPLGEGSIENGWLRCPWHGYDYDPICGALGRRVDHAVDLDDAIRTALEHPGPALVEVIADPDLV